MAKLPSALKKKDEVWLDAAKIRKENLDRLNRGETPRIDPPVTRPQPLADPIRPEVLTVEPAAQPEPIAIEEIQPAPASIPHPDLEEVRRLQAKQETTEGMLRKVNEERRLEQEATRKHIESLLAEKATLQAQAEEQARKERLTKPLSMEDLLKYYTPEEIEEHGEAYCRKQLTISREAGVEAARALFATEAKAREADQKARKAELEQMRVNQARVQEDAFWRSVNTGMPDWQDINAKQEFRTWLLEVEPISQRTRQSAIDEAKAQYDANRIIAVFSAYKQLQPKPVVPAPSKRVLPNGRPPADLPTEPAAPLTVTRQQIAEHNNRVARDKRYRNSPEAQAMASKIDQAARTGGIR